AEALAELEKLYEREKQWDKLADVCARQADLAPDAAKKTSFLQKLGILYGEKLNDNRAAIDAWKRLLKVEPENKRAQDAVKKLYLTLKAWGELEQFFAEQGKLDEYVRVLERQVETEDDATKVELWGKIALLYRDKLGKPDRAMRAFERVLGIDARNRAAAEALIPLYEHAKDPRRRAGVLEIPRGRTADGTERQGRLKRRAALGERDRRDRGAAYGGWLRAFEEDHVPAPPRLEVERLARETGGFTELGEAYEPAVGKVEHPHEALPPLPGVGRGPEGAVRGGDPAAHTEPKSLHAPP